MSEAKLIERFTEEVSEGPICDQAEYFLNAFVDEFEDKFQEIFDLMEQYSSFAHSSKVSVPDRSKKAVSLNDHEMQQFFSKVVGKTMTRPELTQYMARVDVNNNKKYSFIEYLLIKYDKSLEEMFKNIDAEPYSDEVLAEFDGHMAKYNEIMKSLADREAKMKKLEEIAATGGSVAKGKATHTLNEMKAEGTEKRDEMMVEAKKHLENAKNTKKSAPNVKREKVMNAIHKMFNERNSKKADFESANKKKKAALVARTGNFRKEE